MRAPSPARRTDWPRIRRINAGRESAALPKSVATFFILIDLEQGRFKLQFEVNGQSYFLTFVEDERCWCVFAPTASGMRRIPVYVDAATHERFSLPGEVAKH